MAAETGPIIEHFARQWWTFALRGIFAIAFGLLTILMPRLAISLLVFAFGIYALADGISSLAALLRPHWESGWWLALTGVVGLGAGLIALMWPAMTALSLLLLIASWAIVLGIVELIYAVRYGGRPDRADNAFPVGLSGVLWLGFGIIALFWPGPGAVGVLALIAVFAIVRGVILLVVGFRMRSLRAPATMTRPTTRPTH